jgi:hypothetical protein
LNDISLYFMFVLLGWLLGLPNQQQQEQQPQQQQQHHQLQQQQIQQRQQLQQLKQLQQMKGLQDLQLPQFKDMKLPMQNPNQKAVKFDLPEDDDYDDEYDDLDDEDYDDEDFEDELDDPHPPLNKMKPMMGNGQMPNMMMMNGTNPFLIFKWVSVK